MLFYIGQIFCALAITLSLHVIKIGEMNCAEKINGLIEQTALGLYLNDVAYIGIFYLRKFTTEQKMSVGTGSLKEYIPRGVEDSMFRVRKIKEMSFGPSEKTYDVVDPEKLIGQDIVFDGIKKAISGTKTTQEPKRDLSSSSEE